MQLLQRAKREDTARRQQMSSIAIKDIFRQFVACFRHDCDIFYPSSLHLTRFAFFSTSAA